MSSQFYEILGLNHYCSIYHCCSDRQTSEYELPLETHDVGMMITGHMLHSYRHWKNHIPTLIPLIDLDPWTRSFYSIKFRVLSQIKSLTYHKRQRREENRMNRFFCHNAYRKTNRGERCQCVYVLLCEIIVLVYLS